MRQPDAQQAPHEEGPAKSCANSTRPKVTTERGTRWEWRVTWRRHGWQPTTVKSRTFQRRHDALAFANLLDRGNGKYTEVSEVLVDRRPVGPWERVENWERLV